jgi:hypothetical protein
MAIFLPRRNTIGNLRRCILIVTAMKDVNGAMQMMEPPAFPPAADFHASKSMNVALARAEEFLKAGDLADAVKWAAIAAGLRGAQSLPEAA